ncbi:DNA-binding CsgD family transcriptional regulator [Bosea sp. OAE752]|uniref:helix-turn-helix domain-containing protein n=1 Tax=unclassified Bosea (in: a-proteobacteria) TaxID=2653178 RepID=UPI00114EE9DB
MGEHLVRILRVPLAEVPRMPCAATWGASGRPINGDTAEFNSDLHADYLEAGFAERLSSLSKAHRDILSLTARGYLNKEIAWFRGSSEATIKAQQQEILRRLGLRSRTQAAVQYAIYRERLRGTTGQSAEMRSRPGFPSFKPGP